MGYQHQPFTTALISQTRMWRLTAPLRAYFRPRFYGLENFDPAKPTLMVGNHTLFGILDVPLLLARIYRDTGVLVRALADHQHYYVPLWRTLLDRTGAVEGTRENCSELMRRGEHVLVFPGGAREVAKRKGEQYQLTWKRRTGFCAMAIQHHYNILPFASVGPDDMYDILLDAEDILHSPVGKLLRRAGLLEKHGLLRGGDMLMPVPRGLGASIIPRPETFYFALGEPVTVAPFSGRHDDQDALFELRDQVAYAIQDLIGELLLLRETDVDKSWLRRLANQL